MGQVPFQKAKAAFRTRRHRLQPLLAWQSESLSPSPTPFSPPIHASLLITLAPSHSLALVGALQTHPRANISPYWPFIVLRAPETNDALRELERGTHKHLNTRPETDVVALSKTTPSVRYKRKHSKNIWIWDC